MHQSEDSTHGRLRFCIETEAYRLGELVIGDGGRLGLWQIRECGEFAKGEYERIEIGMQIVVSGNASAFGEA